jgi:hypothetical protein
MAVLQQFEGTWKHPEHRGELGLRLRRNMFPFIPDHREIWIDKMALLFAVPGEREEGSEREQCPCPEPKVRDCFDVAFFREDEEQRCEDKDEEKEWEETIVRCVSSREWPDLYYGIWDTRLEPLRPKEEDAEVKFRFGKGIEAIPRAYVFCHYAAAP